MPKSSSWAQFSTPNPHQLHIKDKHQGSCLHHGASVSGGRRDVDLAAVWGQKPRGQSVFGRSAWIWMAAQKHRLPKCWKGQSDSRRGQLFCLMPTLLQIQSVWQQTLAIWDSWMSFPIPHLQLLSTCWKRKKTWLLLALYRINKIC